MIMKTILSVSAIMAGINAIMLTGNCSDLNINNKSEYSLCKNKPLNSINSVQVYKKPIIEDSFKDDNNQSIRTFCNTDAKIYAKKILRTM